MKHFSDQFVDDGVPFENLHEGLFLSSHGELLAIHMLFYCLTENEDLVHFLTHCLLREMFVLSHYFDHVPALVLYLPCQIDYFSRAVFELRMLLELGYLVLHVMGLVAHILGEYTSFSPFASGLVCLDLFQAFPYIEKIQEAGSHLRVQVDSGYSG